MLLISGCERSERSERSEHMNIGYEENVCPEECREDMKNMCSPG
jgi:hypothetical protein